MLEGVRTHLVSGLASPGSGHLGPGLDSSAGTGASGQRAGTGNIRGSRWTHLCTVALNSPFELTVLKQKPNIIPGLKKINH